MTHRFDPFAALRTAAAGENALAVGIDLGTTNSALASAQISADGTIGVACLREQPSDPMSPFAMPSVVAVDGDRFLVGREARRLLGERHETAQGKSVFAETKNEMGLAYTYWKAPDALNDATKVASHVLDGLVRRCDGQPSTDALVPVVVGVPAAFQGAQRTATLAAAESAGLGDADGLALIDEPVAIFLDLLHSGALAGDDAARLRRVLVFDFGGGTCDVALFDIDLVATPPHIVLRGTSRYHRLGGGDIDRAIVHQVLLPQLLAQNRVQSLDLGWRQKKREIEPCLLLVAEGLKQTLCRRLAQAKAAGRVLPDDTEMVDTRQHRLQAGERTLWLENATLTLPAFLKTLEPFLDESAHEPAPNEYFNALSIFEPINSLTERLRVEPDSVDAVVFGGGSSLIPPVRDAVLRRFNKARALGSTDPEHLMGAVARGAALQALSLAVTGAPLIRPVTGIDVAIRTTESLVSLIAEGEALPIAARRIALTTPRASTTPLDISIEIIGATHRLLFRQTWTLPPPVRAGEPLDLEVSVDENQAIRLRLARRDGDVEEFRRTLHAPLSHTDASHKVRMRVLEREERIRRGSVDDADRGVEFRRLAEDYGELRHFEKAIDAMRTSIAAGEDTHTSLNQIGIWYGRLQDKDREEQYYRRAIEAEPLTHAMFNLALVRRERGDVGEARLMVERACRHDPAEPCYRILAADLARRAGDVETSAKLIADVANEDFPPERMSDWQLGWFEVAAKLADDSAWQVRLKLERERRKARPQDPRIGVLPAPAAPLRARLVVLSDSLMDDNSFTIAPDDCTTLRVTAAPIDDLIVASRGGFRLYELFRVENAAELIHYVDFEVRSTRPERFAWWPDVWHAKEGPSVLGGRLVGSRIDPMPGDVIPRARELAASRWPAIEAARSACRASDDPLDRHELELIDTRRHPNDEAMATEPEPQRLTRYFRWAARREYPLAFYPLVRELLACPSITAFTLRSGPGDWHAIKLACAEQISRAGAYLKKEDRHVFPVRVATSWSGHSMYEWDEPYRRLDLDANPDWTAGVRFQSEGLRMQGVFLDDGEYSTWVLANKESALRPEVQILLTKYAGDDLSVARCWYEHADGFRAGVAPAMRDELEPMLLRHGMTPWR